MLIVSDGAGIPGKRVKVAFLSSPRSSTPRCDLSDVSRRRSLHHSHSVAPPISHTALWFQSLSLIICLRGREVKTQSGSQGMTGDVGPVLTLCKPQ